MRALSLLTALLLLASVLPRAQAPLERDAERWVERTMKTLTPDQMVGQLLMPRFSSVYTSSDSDVYDELTRLVHEAHVGGIIGFGGEEPVPQVLLNPTYGPIVLGQPLAMASMLNRLQAIAPVPLLTASDFEWGVGMRIAGGTKFPRAMAFGAAGDEQLAFEAGRITATEGRALGVHVNFAPVADVNNNPRNPVINIRSFGEDPARVGALAAAWTRGLQQGGMLATLKHFPGHGDTSVDSHLGLPLIEHPRERLHSVELAPFKAGIAAEAAAVMVAHIELPALDPSRGPATFSQPIVTGLLREQLGFRGLIFTDSMLMDGVARLGTSAENAVRAVLAGNDMVLDAPDMLEAFRGLTAAVQSGVITRARLEASVRRILMAKARLGLHKTPAVNLDSVPIAVGGRRHAAVARQVSERALTLIKDERNSIPLRLRPGATVLYLSVLDYPRGWRIAAPSRAMIPALRERWPNLQSIEVSDATTPNELALVRSMASRFDAVVAGVFVRASSGTNRLDLAAPVAGLLQDLARASARANQPFVAAFFGSPYAPLSVPDVPAMLLTFDFSDVAEESAVRALAGEIPIGGKLPIALPGMFPLGHGLTRSADGVPNAVRPPGQDPGVLN
ncbi:MAG TPA: glycoside hydrolase family 3 protein [Vicinamibacterales bacterium]|nr:glycoside hydrolase family 3 protein [Vicinamibacterales bacterium]